MFSLLSNRLGQDQDWTGKPKVEGRTVYNPLQKRCITCNAKSYRGAANPRWKGGVTPANKKIRNSEEYRQWRIAVFTRDNYTCVLCGQHGGQLNADHVLPFSTHPDLRLDVSNGRTLCEPCHMRTPSYPGGAKRLQRLACEALNAAG